MKRATALVMAIVAAAAWTGGAVRAAPEEPQEFEEVSDLICYPTSNGARVIRIAQPDDGTVIREIPCQNVLKLRPSRYREGCLMALTFSVSIMESGKDVTEIDLFGNLLWSLPDLPFDKNDIIDVESLSNGNVVLTLQKKRGIVEIDRQGIVQRELNIDTEHAWMICCADDGNLLIVPGKQINSDAPSQQFPYEMTWKDRKPRLIGPSHKETKEWNELWMSSLKLPDGHYIIGSLKSISEWDGEGKLIWRTRGVEAGQLHRMGNGNILTASG